LFYNGCYFRIISIITCDELHTDNIVEGTAVGSCKKSWKGHVPSEGVDRRPTELCITRLPGELGGGEDEGDAGGGLGASKGIQ
jgi:hypothetical protein